jgi:hypothetical protein
MKMADTISKHNADYDPPDAYKQYTDEELQWWVKLLRKRAGMRVPGPKRDKDNYDADNYEKMLKERTPKA